MAATETTTETTTEVHRTPRLRQGALIAAGSAVALGIVMFAMAWYGLDEIPGRVPARMPLPTRSTRGTR